MAGLNVVETDGIFVIWVVLCDADGLTLMDANGKLTGVCVVAKVLKFLRIMIS